MDQIYLRDQHLYEECENTKLNGQFFNNYNQEYNICSESSSIINQQQPHLLIVNESESSDNEI